MSPLRLASAAGPDALDTFAVQVYWANEPLGFGQPRPLLLFVDSQGTAERLARAVHESMEAARVRQQRYNQHQEHAAGEEEDPNLASASVVSGLLFKRDVSARSAGAGAPASTTASAGAGAGGSSKTDSEVDYVQHALMNGEISVDEALLLRFKNLEVMEKMEVLEHELAAQRAIEPAPIAQIALPSPYALPSRREKPHFVEGTSESRIILSDEILTEINGELFDRHRDMAWRMLYDLMDHGVCAL